LNYSATSRGSVRVAANAAVWLEMFVEQIALGSQWLRRRRAESRGMALIRPRSGASPAGCEVAVAACCRHHLQRTPC
jgi:hypothetical protein